MPSNNYSYYYKPAAYKPAYVAPAYVAPAYVKPAYVKPAYVAPAYTGGYVNYYYRDPNYGYGYYYMAKDSQGNVELTGDASVLPSQVSMTSMIIGATIVASTVALAIKCNNT